MSAQGNLLPLQQPAPAARQPAAGPARALQGPNRAQQRGRNYVITLQAASRADCEGKLAGIHGRCNLREVKYFVGGTPIQCSNYCKKGEQPHDEWTIQGIEGPNFGLNAHFLEFGEIPMSRQDASARGNHPMLVWMRSAPVELFPSCTLTSN